MKTPLKLFYIKNTTLIENVLKIEYKLENSNTTNLQLDDAQMEVSGLP